VVAPPVPIPSQPVAPPKEAVSIAPVKPKEKPPAPKPVTQEAPAPAVPQTKKSLKRETYLPDAAVAKAISNLKENLDTSRPAAVDAAIDRIKAAAGPAQAIERLKAKVDGAGGGGGGGGESSGGGGGGGGGALSIEDMYRLEAAYTVNKNWAFSESFSGGRSDLFAEVAFTVLPDGQIKDIWFDRRSGNDYLDESARRAILKSNPLAPHPKGVRRPFITVGLRFTPKGVLQ
jgi:colicin import membrane protein